jgi:hypothetical protein
MDTMFLLFPRSKSTTIWSEIDACDEQVALLQASWNASRNLIPFMIERIKISNDAAKA